MAANLEVKARDPDPERTLGLVRALGVEDRGRFFQRDTFFVMPEGRLKLREQDGGAELIHYVRVDEAGPRVSSYSRIAARDPGALKELLSAALGIDVVVEKHRHLLLKGNVRIHLDDVTGLGSFVELEAVVPPGRSPRDEEEGLAELMDSLGIAPERLVAEAYADALRATA